MIVARVRRTIRERALFDRGARVLVACSGGPDSAAMLHALHRLDDLGITLFAASVNHGLRPDAAHDVEVAGGLASALGVPFASLSVEVPSEGASTMAKARRARYAALIAHARELDATAIAVGHTMDDQAETVVLRAIRGGGALGLSGIDPRRPDGIVRPLIDCARVDVHAHVAHHGLPFVRDASNTNRAFLRSRIREDLLPRLVTEDPRAIEHLAELADDARELRTWVERAADDLLDQAGRGDDLDAALVHDAPLPCARARSPGGSGLGLALALIVHTSKHWNERWTDVGKPSCRAMCAQESMESCSVQACHRAPPASGPLKGKTLSNQAGSLMYCNPYAS